MIREAMEWIDHGGIWADVLVFGSMALAIVLCACMKRTR